MVLNQSKYIKLLEHKLIQIQFLVASKNRPVLDKLEKNLNMEVFLTEPKTEEEKQIYAQKMQELENHITENGYNYSVPIIFEESKDILVITEEELKLCYE